VSCSCDIIRSGGILHTAVHSAAVRCPLPFRGRREKSYYVECGQSTRRSNMDRKQYDLEYFRENGFKRRKCAHCGKFFWTAGDSKLCGEPPCVEYTFLGNSPMKKHLSVSGMREEFLSFMERNGHTRIRRYPIVARWRNDVFFVQASIYNFQPWVTGGTVKPPANPLTMSQPCARFVDIDNVGRTGRHFTLFEMMTHTCFNTPDNFVYFKDRTVELCNDFIAKDLGVNSELIIFKEDDWEGGGNSGPCFEVLVEGSEVATLVFMMYSDAGGRKTPMNMTVVDTGYGLERLAWVSQGSPSAYEAVFGTVLEELKEELGIESDDRLLSEYSRIAGLMDAKTPGAIRETREMVAKNMGISADELLRRIIPLENLYTLLDHTRSLSLMLNDGVMPSNAREGYFARLLIRRGIRALSNLNSGMRLAEIVGRQLDYWARDFPELKEDSGDIMKIVEVEERKYQDTVARGRSVVSRLEASNGGKGISLDNLIELYESHGLSPEQVAEFASSKVEIPDDFYARMASRRIAAAEEKKAEEAVKLPPLPPTVRAYYESQYVTEFEATVLHCDDSFIVLDRTYFYPEGGGQDPDTGYIEKRRVKDVQLSGGIIVHLYEGSRLATGTKVRCSIDRERRMNLMRHHTATHVLIAGARKVLGNHVWQAGAHKQSDVSRLDITHYEQLTAAEIATLEETVNSVIFEDRKITVEVMDRIEAERRYGFRLYQGGVVPGKDIRVVTVEGWDVEACAGTHCERTGEIGTFKILRTARIQDGVVRIEFVAGMPALHAMQEMSRQMEMLREELNADEQHLVSAVRQLQSRLRETEKRAEKKESMSLEELGQQLLEKSARIGDTRLVFHITDAGTEQMRPLMRILSREEKTLALIVAGRERDRIMIGRGPGCSVDCSALMGKIGEKFGGKGGGSADFAQGTVNSVDENEFLSFLKKALGP
jgi:alanyl-tRNA synthetase